MTVKRLIGSAPSQVSRNRDLGTMAFQDSNSYYSTAVTYGLKNKFINGSFDIWQRSTGPVTGADYRTVDRMLFPDSTQISQRVANDRADANTPYALQVSSNPSTGYNQIGQRIEDVTTLAGKVVTLSFWAKASVAGRFRVACFQGFGTGGSSSVSVLESTSGLGEPFVMNAPNTWQKFVRTFQLPSVSGKTIGANSYIQVGVGGQHDYNNVSHTFTLAEFQLEEGPVATAFERRPIGVELALCKRYYQVYGGPTAGTSGYDPIGAGIWRSTTIANIFVHLPVEMRSTPTITPGSVSYFSVGVTNAQPSSVTTDVASPKVCMIDFNMGSALGTTGYATRVFINSSSGRLEFSAEL